MERDSLCIFAAQSSKLTSEEHEVFTINGFF